MDSRTLATSSAESRVFSRLSYNSFHLITVTGSGVPFEQLPEPLVVQRVSFFLQPLDGDAGREYRAPLVVGEPLHGQVRLLGDPLDHLSQQDGSGGSSAGVEDLRPARDAIDQIDDVVQP